MGLTVTRIAIRAGVSGQIGRAIDVAVAYRVVTLANRGLFLMPHRVRSHFG
jgi:hypothetical protein